MVYKLLLLEEVFMIIIVLVLITGHNLNAIKNLLCFCMNGNGARSLLGHTVCDPSCMLYPFVRRWNTLVSEISAVGSSLGSSWTVLEVAWFHKQTGSHPTDIMVGLHKTNTLIPQNFFSFFLYSTLAVNPNLTCRLSVTLWIYFTCILFYIPRVVI